MPGVVAGNAPCAALAAGAALTFTWLKFDPNKDRKEISAVLYHALADRPSAANRARSSNSSNVISENC